MNCKRRDHKAIYTSECNGGHKLKANGGNEVGGKWGKAYAIPFLTFKFPASKQIRAEWWLLVHESRAKNIKAVKRKKASEIRPS